MDEKELAAFVDNEELEINKDVNTVSEGPTLKVEKNLMEMTTEAVSYTHLDVYKRQPFYLCNYIKITTNQHHPKSNCNEMERR